MVEDSENQVNILHPMFIKIRLFSLKGGVELLNNDNMGNIEG